MGLKPKVLVEKNDEGFFWTMESQGRPTAKSARHYTRKSSCLKGIEAFMAGAAVATIVDLTNGEFELRPSREHVDQETRRWIFETDGGVCHICNELVDPFDWHIDHVNPWSQSKSNAIENLRVAHPRCNMSKGDRPLVKSLTTPAGRDPWQRPWPVL